MWQPLPFYLCTQTKQVNPISNKWKQHEPHGEQQHDPNHDDFIHITSRWTPKGRWHEWSHGFQISTWSTIIKPLLMTLKKIKMYEHRYHIFYIFTTHMRGGGLSLLHHKHPNLKRVVNPTIVYAMFVVVSYLQGNAEACQIFCGISRQLVHQLCPKTDAQQL